jgi:hypothetical protein
MAKNRIIPTTVKINLSSGMIQNAQVEANRIGISLQDFIRMLMATYFANSSSIRAVSRDQTLFDNAQIEIKNMEFTKVGNKKELDMYLKRLDN